MYVEPRKMVQMNWFAGQKLRHRCREQTYGHQGGETVLGWGWWCSELGDLIDMYTLMCIKLMTDKNLQYKKTKQINKQKTSNTKLSLGYLYGNMLI